MSEQEDMSIVKKSTFLLKVGNQITITNKLLVMCSEVSPTDYIETETNLKYIAEQNEQEVLNISKKRIPKKLADATIEDLYEVFERFLTKSEIDEILKNKHF